MGEEGSERKEIVISGGRYLEHLTTYTGIGHTSELVYPGAIVQLWQMPEMLLTRMTQ